MMKYLYDKYKLNPNQTTKVFKLQSSNTKGFTCLVSTSSQTGWSPLFIPTKQGHIKIVEYLVNCLHVNLHDPNNMVIVILIL